MLSLTFLIELIYTQTTQIPIGVKSQAINLEDKCQGYQISTNYKHVRLNIEKMKKMDKLIITDLPMADCSIRQCDRDANICQSKLYIVKHSKNSQ
jgi:hypothetical protein